MGEPVVHGPSPVKTHLLHDAYVFVQRGAAGAIKTAVNRADAADGPHLPGERLSSSVEPHACVVHRDSFAAGELLHRRSIDVDDLDGAPMFDLQECE